MAGILTVELRGAQGLRLSEGREPSVIAQLRLLARPAPRYACLDEFAAD
jgi:hypothetical protein